MPYIKFDTPSGTSSNKGSCNAFVEYLQKEDTNLKSKKEFFFNHSNEMINSRIVIESINTNRQGLKKEDAKFYTGSINLSEEELKFINNDFDKIKQYTIEVFKQYADNFKKDLSIDDINWFAKIESNRYYKGNDEEVARGKAKQGEVKPGLNTHAHFIVGRKSVDGNKKLSPMTNHMNTSKGAVKGGFNRDQFKQDCEGVFDNLFFYNRSINESYKHLKNVKKGKRESLRKFVREQSVRLKYDQLSNDDKINKLEKLINHINKNIEFEGNNAKLEKSKLLEEAHSNNYNGDIYRSLININFKIIENNLLPKDINQYVLNYSNYLNQPYNKLPVSVKQDKVERYIYMLNRKLPQGLEKISVDKVLEFEKSSMYSGKSFKYLNEVNKLLKENNKELLDSKIDHINNSLRKVNIKYSESKQHSPIYDKETFDTSIDSSNYRLPSIKSLGFSLGYNESEDEKKRKKKKKKRNDNDFDRSF